MPNYALAIANLTFEIEILDDVAQMIVFISVWVWRSSELPPSADNYKLKQL